MQYGRGEVIGSCLQCHLACQEALGRHAREKEGMPLSTQHIERMTATIQLSMTAAEMLVMRSPLADHFCELAAGTARECASQCEATELDAMKYSAEMCWRCAEALSAQSAQLQAA